MCEHKQSLSQTQHFPFVKYRDIKDDQLHGMVGRGLLSPQMVGYKYACSWHSVTKIKNNELELYCYQCCCVDITEFIVSARNIELNLGYPIFPG